jgi:hypothetical protein
MMSRVAANSVGCKHSFAAKHAGRQEKQATSALGMGGAAGERKEDREQVHGLLNPESRGHFLDPVSGKVVERARQRGKASKCPAKSSGPS